MTSTMLPRMATDRFAIGLAIAATLIATLCISTATTTQAQQSAQPRCPAGYWLLEPVCLRPLPSTGHYPASPVQRTSRHPRRPGLILTDLQLVGTPHHRCGVSRVAPISLCLHAVATTPAESLGARLALVPQ